MAGESIILQLTAAFENVYRPYQIWVQHIFNTHTWTHCQLFQNAYRPYQLWVKNTFNTHTHTHTHTLPIVFLLPKPSSSYFPPQQDHSASNSNVLMWLQFHSAVQFTIGNDKICQTLYLPYVISRSLKSVRYCYKLLK